MDIILLLDLFLLTLADLFEAKLTLLDLSDLCHFNLGLILNLLIVLMQVVGGEIRTLLPFLPDLSVADCQSQIRKIVIQLLLI